MKQKVMLNGNSKCTRLKSLATGDGNRIRNSIATIFFILAAISLLASISPAMGQTVTASSSGVWTDVDGGSYVTGVSTSEVRWGNARNDDNPDRIKSGLRFDGQSLGSTFGQEFCLGKLTHFNYPITNAASGATLQITMHFTNPSLGDVSFTYDMAIDETTNSGTCSQCQYSPCSVPCPDKIAWPSIPPADQTFTLGSDTYTLQVVGIKDACEGGSSLPHFITQEKKTNEGYLVARIVLTSRPDAIDDFYNTKTNVPLTVPAPGVLGNDFDVDGDDLDVISYTQPANGVVTVNSEDGSMTYTPDEDFCGTDTFTYTIEDDDGKFDTATVTITVVCDDGNACTIDACVDGICTHTAIDCDDGNLCTDDSCDPATGVCVNAANTASCDDGNACTVGDVCADKACTSGTPLVCSDNNVCNGVETCDPATGCTNPADLVCDDGKFCTGEETCDPVAGCQDGSDPGVDDGIDCTADSCDETNDVIVHTPNNGYCSDSDACNGVETCDPATGCTNPADLVCDDGKFCTGEETCDPVAGCQDGSDPGVDDGIDCTADSCDESNDQVVHTPNNGYCSDGNFCNGIETCDPVDDCQDGTAPVCDDGLYCNGEEYCDEGTDSCAPGTPAECNDDDVCNGIETCDEGTDTCAPGTDVVCDDQDGCTEDACDPADGCIYTPTLPEANDDSYAVASGKTLTIAVGNGVLMNDEYYGGGVLTALKVTGPSHGTLTLKADGSFTYKPVTGFVGTDTFTYKALNGNCDSEPATVKILVAKCPWSIVNEMYKGQCNSTMVVLASKGVLANDPTAVAVVNPEGITIDPKYGTIEVFEDGSFVYNAAPKIVPGTYVQFKYWATNGVCDATYQGIAKIQMACVCD